MASIVDASLVAGYHWTSKYLLMTKYNNYAEVFGDGIIVAPFSTPTLSKVPRSFRRQTSCGRSLPEETFFSSAIPCGFS
jgi:hypothetical protein